MLKHVRCILPGGRSQVLLLGPHLTPHTFLVATRNLLTTFCKLTTLRYGTPPDYVSIPLRGELSSAQPVLLDINDHETVWIDVCPKCREKEERAWLCCSNPSPPVPTPSRTVTTLRDIQTNYTGICYPPFNKQELSHGGYYHCIALRECGLEHFSLYVFSNAPHLQFLYSTQLDTLTELPRLVTELKEHGAIPQELMSPGGFLYHLLSTHTTLKHMNFYRLCLLPGRMLVYDAGLDRLTETHPLSDLTLSLFPNMYSSENRRSSTSTSVDEGGSAGLDEAAAENVVQCWRVATNLLESSASVSESGCVDGGESRMVRHTQPCDTDDSKQSTYCCLAGSMDLPSSPLNAPSPSSSAIRVYEPSTLDVSIPMTRLQARCHIPPCVYIGVDTDPR